MFRRSAPEPETVPSPEETARAFLLGLMEMQQTLLEPLRESALAMRNSMTADGWSETAAETASLTWLNGMIELCTRGIK